MIIIIIEDSSSLLTIPNLALWPKGGQNKGASQEWGQHNPSFKIAWMKVQEGKANDWKFLLQMNKLIRRWKCQNGIMVDIFLNIENPIVYQQWYVNACIGQIWTWILVFIVLYPCIFCFPKVTYIPKLDISLKKPSNSL